MVTRCLGRSQSEIWGTATWALNVEKLGENREMRRRRRGCQRGTHCFSAFGGGPGSPGKGGHAATGAGRATVRIMYECIVYKGGRLVWIGLLAVVVCRRSPTGRIWQPRSLLKIGAGTYTRRACLSDDVACATTGVTHFSNIDPLKLSLSCWSKFNLKDTLRRYPAHLAGRGRTTQGDPR